MSPDDYDLYHKFEKNLLPAEGTNTPCADKGYPRYKKTQTHGAGPIKMTFDMYTIAHDKAQGDKQQQQQQQQIKGATMQAEAPKVGASWNPFKPDTDPCCEDCDTSAGLAKFWSIDDIFNQCGEACMSPDDYDLYHKFEKNLLPAEGTNTPCADKGYPRYKKTQTHGAGPIKMTFDMYTIAHDKN